MDFNIKAILVAALVPLIIGFIWYHKNVFGTAWMRTIGATEESLKGANMGLIFGLSLVFAFLISFMIPNFVIHQNSIYSTLGNNPNAFLEGAKIELLVNGEMQDYTNNFRTFKHGSLHGFLIGLLFVMPVMATNALFERKGFKYIAINCGYWIVSLTIMGGIICAWRS